MKTYEPHPLALMFPSMDDAAINALAADIQANGLQNPIVLLDGKILDGIQRQKACRREGVQPLYVQFSLLSRAVVKAGALKYVVSQNLHRRHLSESQRAIVAAKLANMKQGARTDLEPCSNSSKVSQSQAAKLLNVSRTSVQAAKRVLDTEPDGVADDIIAGKKRLASVKPKAKPRKAKAPKPFDDQVWAKWDKLLKHFDPTKRRDVKRAVVGFLFDKYEHKIQVAPVTITYSDGTTKKIEDIFKER